MQDQEWSPEELQHYLDILVGGYVKFVESRKSSLGPTEIAFFVFLVLFKDEGCRVSPRFHLFTSDVN